MSRIGTRQSILDLDKVVEELYERNAEQLEAEIEKVQSMSPEELAERRAALARAFNYRRH